jgi:hypothetical protein
MLNFFEDIKDPIFLLWNSQFRTVKSMNSHIVDFKRYLINNKFIGENVKNESIKCVDEILRKAFLRYKYGKLWLVNCIKRTASVNGFDLELNEIDENKKDVIVYVDIGARRKYLFSQKDFRKLIITNLENSYIFDHLPQPLPIRNPYTNKEFSKLELIEIDSMLIDSPLIWNMYRDCKYNLERFKLINYNYLMIYSAGSYVDQLEKDDIVFYIEDIFMFYNFVNYCELCLEDRGKLKNRKLKGILIDWFLFQKRLGIFTKDDLNTICEMFKMNCLKHDKKDEATVKYFDSSIINFEFTGGPIKDNFVFKAASNNDLNKRKLKNKKNKKKIKKSKKVLKKKVVIKTIS